MRPVKPALALGALVIGTVALAAPALAYFDITGDNPNGYARAALINPPTVKAHRTLLGQVVFTVKDAPPGYEPDGYKVVTGNENRVCEINDEDGVCSPGLLDLYFGKQTFKIRSYLGNWTSAPTICTFDTFAGVADCGSGTPSGSLLISLAATTPLLSISDDLGISSSDGITNITEVKLLGHAIARSTIVLFSDGSEIGRGVANDDGEYAIDVRLEEGVHHLTALTTYEGDSSPHSSEASITVDLTAPRIKVDLEGSVVSGTAGTAPGDRNELKVVAGSEADTVRPSSSGKFATEVEAPEGTKVTVSQSDAAGNKASETVIVEGKKAEEPKTEEPKTEAPKEEPKSEEPKAEEPKPAPEEPAAPAQP